MTHAGQLRHDTAAHELVQLVCRLRVIDELVVQVGEVCVTYLVTRQLQLQAAGLDYADHHSRNHCTRAEFRLTSYINSITASVNQ